MIPTKPGMPEALPGFVISDKSVTGKKRNNYCYFWMIPDVRNAKLLRTWNCKTSVISCGTAFETA